MEELLGSYQVKRIDIQNYKVSFDIPDNCNFSIDEKDGIYTVNIELKSGETTPSKTYVTHTFDTKAVGGEIEIAFKQKDNPYNRTKPRMKILIDG